LFFQAIVPVICLVVNALTQVLLFRRVPRIGLLKTEYLGFMVGGAALLLFESRLGLSRDSLGILAVNLLTYVALGYCYFHFVNLGETARRIRILRELYEAKNGLTMDEILSCYNAKSILDIRLARLLNNGQIISGQGRYFIKSPVVLLMARAMILMKLIVMGGKTEFGLR